MLNPNKEYANARLARWALAISGYSFEVQPRKGITNQNADIISCNPDNNPTVNADIDTLHTRPEILNISSVYIGNEFYKNMTQIRNMQEDDELTNYILNKFKTANITELGPYRITGGVLQYKHKENYKIFATQNMQLQILHDFHDNKFTGHYGFKKTYKHIKMHYYWPDMKAQIYEYCKTCHICQTYKFKNQNILAELQCIQVQHPFERLGMDCIGPLPLTAKGKKYILIFTDYFTKYTIAHALRSIVASEIAQIFVECVVCRFGAPIILHSDLGTNFTSALMEEITALCQTKQTFTTAYHPQANGQVE